MSEDTFPNIPNVAVQIKGMFCSVLFNILGLTMAVPYANITPYDTGMLAVSGIHTIYYEQAGNPYGNPVLNLYVSLSQCF